MRRVLALGLIALLIANVTNLLLVPLFAAAGAEGAFPLTVGPTTAVAGTTIHFSAAGFGPGEALAGLVVTPAGQQLALAGVGSPGVLVLADAAGPPALVADASGGVDGTLATAANYQSGDWAIILRGADTGVQAEGSFTLTAPQPAAVPTAITTPAATPTPAASPTPTPSPSPAPASAEPSAPPAASPAATAPAATPAASPPTTASAAPAASASPASASPASSPATPTPEATGTPVATSAPSAAPATPTTTSTPSATPTTPATPLPSPSVTPPRPGPASPGPASPGAAMPAASPAASPSATPEPSASPAASPSPSPSPAPDPSPAPNPSPPAPEMGPGAKVVVKVPGGGANLRQQPSTDAPVAQAVADGTPLTIIGISVRINDYTWWPVQGEGIQGWVVGDVLSLVTGALPAPSTAPPSPASPDHGVGVPMPPVDGPALAPSQLLPTFAQAAQLSGVPQHVLLAIARVESGFDARAIGPYLPQFAGTENEHALGLMQFLPSSYRPYAARIDAITGKNLGMQGIWDAESSIYAAAFYLAASGAPGNLRGALFAYNNADWYVDLILAWSAQYAGGTIADSSLFDPTLNGPPILAAPQNPILPNNSRHVDLLTPIQLYAPWPAGETWYAGGDGSYYGDGFHSDGYGAYYAVDFNKGTWPRSEEDDGEPILAAADGIVNNIYQDAAGAWVVELYHVAPDGTQLRTLYVHLKMDPRINPGIKVNQPVLHGTPIGVNGGTGNATGPHLHFGLWMLKDGQWVSIRAEPLEGQYLANGTSITSTNRPPTAAGLPHLPQFGFWPIGPSNADTVTVATVRQPGDSPAGQIEVFANTAGDGSDRGQWLPIGTFRGDQAQLQWLTAPLAEGTYRLLFVATDQDGNRTFQGLTSDTAIRYAVRRGAVRASVVANPRADLTLLAPLDGATLAAIGGHNPIVSGPLRFTPATGPQPGPALVGQGVAVAGALAGAPPSGVGQVRQAQALFVEEGTTNLILNPSFERGTEGWTVRNLPGGALAAQPADGGLFGRSLLRLDNRAGTSAAALATAAGDGEQATWSVYARVAAGSPATTVQLAMSGLPARDFALTGDWQRLVFSGATGGIGTERQIIVPAGVTIEIDGAQLETKPYATSYADGSLGPAYGWDRVADASLSGRLPTLLQVPLAGLATPERGALSFWATPVGDTGAEARLITLGEKLTLTIAGSEATLRWGDLVLGTTPWERGVTRYYALGWERDVLTFLVDGQVAGQAQISDFALPSGAILTLGSDPSGARSANATIQDLALWAEMPAPDVFAAVARAGAFLHPGIPQVLTYDVGLALAAQGLAPTNLKLQFSFDGQTWTEPEPYAPTKTLTLPSQSGDAQIYVRFTDEAGKSIVVVDHIQVIASPRGDWDRGRP